MNPHNSPPETSLAVSQLLEIHQVCDRFEQALQAGQQPKIEQFLGGTVEPQRSKLKQELESLAAEYRTKARRPISPQFLLRRLTESGLMTAQEVAALVGSWPKGGPKTAEEVIRELRRRRALTEYQAQAVRRGQIDGLVLGNYVLLDKLGEGGMGQVFRATHRRMARVVALKTLPPSATRSADLVKRFQREVKAAALLTHPNIVTAYDADEARGMHFLVMEYVDGRDLGRLVREQGPMALATGVDHLVQAARGLEYAHGQGVVHRDIKPANLLVDRQGRVKILDLGLARVEETIGAVDDGLTRSGQLMGTLDYMAPEQAYDTHQAKAEADIYSLGCTLFYLLAGHAPFLGHTVTQKILAHREQPIPSLRDVRPDVPEWLDQTCGKMLQKQPEDRFRTMSEVISALTQQPLPVGPPPGLGATSPQLAVNTVGFDQSDMQTSSEELKAQSASPAAIHRWSSVAAVCRGWIDRCPKNLVAAVGTMLMAVFLGIVVTLKTPEGTLVVEIDDPNVTVQVLDDEGKVQIARKGEKGTPLTIRVDPGKHRLRAEKDGLEFYAKDFEIAAGGGPVRIRLEPPSASALMKGPKPASDVRPTVPVGPVVKPSRFSNSRLLVLQPPPLPEVATWTVETSNPREFCSAGVLSPDEKLFAVAGVNGLIRFFDPQTGIAKKILVNPEPNITSLTWSPDSARLAVGTQGSLIRVWDVADGRILAEFNRPGASGVALLTWSPDGKRLAVCRAGSPGEVWTTPEGKVDFPLLAKQETNYVAVNCTWHPNGKQLVTVAYPGEARIWHVDTPQQYTILPIKEKGELQIPAAAYSPDGKRLALHVLGEQAVISLWDMETLKETARSPRMEHGAREPLRWSYDGQFLALSHWGGGHILDMRTMRPYPNDNMGMMRYGDSPAGWNWIRGSHELVAVGGRAGLARLRFHPERASDQPSLDTVWSVPASWTDWDYYSHSVSLSDDGRSIAMAIVNESRWLIGEWDVLTGAQRVAPKGLPVYARHIEHLSSGELAVVGGGGAILWDMEAGKPSANMSEVIDGSAGAWTSAAGRLAVATEQGARVWSPRPINMMGNSVKTDKPVDCVGWSPDASQLAVGLRTGDVLLADAKATQVVHTFKPPLESPVRGLLWLAEGRLLVVQEAGVLCVYDTVTGNREGAPSQVNAQCTGTALLQDKGVVVLASPDPGMLLWDTSRRDVTGRFSGTDCRTVAASRDGNTVASVHHDRLIVWDTRNWQPLRSFVVWPDGTYLSVASDGEWCGSPGIESCVRYVLLDQQGRQATLTPAEFKTRYADPDRDVAKWTLRHGGMAEISIEGDESPRVVQSLAALPQRRFHTIHIDLWGKTAVAEEGLPDCSGLQHMLALGLSNTGITDSGIAPVERMSTLRGLDIGGANLTETGFRHLGALTQLEELQMGGVRVSDESLGILGGMKRLRMLQIGWPGMTNRCLEVLKGHESLVTLNVRGTSITDEGIVHLKAFPALQDVVLSDTQITDQALEQLACMKGLTQLALAGCRVTVPAVARLQAALPNCQISVDPAIQAELDKTASWSPLLSGRELQRKMVQLALTQGYAVRISANGEERLLDPAHPELPETFAVVALDILLPPDKVGLLAGLRDLRSLSLVLAGPASDDSLNPLWDLNSLESLFLGRVFNDKAFQGIGRLSNLQSLGVDCVSDGVFTYLTGLRKLHALDVINAFDVTGKGFQSLAELPELHSISTNYLPLTDDGIEELKRLKSLRAFSVGGNRDVHSRITNRGAGHLAEVAGMEVLSLNWAEIDDSGVEKLTRLAGLRELVLANTHITDKALRHLDGMKSLRALALEGTKVTAAGVVALQKALPECRISVDAEIQAELERTRK